jgi:hypothetical protein
MTRQDSCRHVWECWSPKRAPAGNRVCGQDEATLRCRVCRAVKIVAVERRGGHRPRREAAR